MGKEWDPVSWGGGTWEDPDEAEDVEPLNPEESSLLMGEFSLPLGLTTSLPPVVCSSVPQFEGINAAMPKKIVTASPEAAVMQDNTDSPHDFPPR